MQFDPSKTKKLYQNGFSNMKTIKQKPKIESFEEWSILAPTGDLIGFIQLENEQDLPQEIWIRDKKYKLCEKINH